MSALKLHVRGGWACGSLLRQALGRGTTLLRWATNALLAIQKHSFLGYAASLPQMSGTTATPSSEPLQNKPPTAERN